MAGKKYYVVKAGRIPGIYQSWEECKKQIDKYSGAIYKGFLTLEEANAYLMGEVANQTDIQNREKHNPYKAQERTTVHKKELSSLQQKEAQMIAYVDGSYNNKTKEYSYGMVILYQGTELKFAKKVEEPSLVSMRNVAGEIKGAEAAMRYAVSKGCTSLVIYHDYEGISRWCLGEWRANKEGTKAYKAYYNSIKESLHVTFQKVKGHSGDKYNEMADQLAKSAIF